jgi:alpha-D-ribose 1-methylphosphonate 5-triphosphate synthase subunit PhnG
MLQDPGRRPVLEAGVIAPLRARQEEQRAAARARAAGTRVEFFTMVRGEE